MRRGTCSKSQLAAIGLGCFFVFLLFRRVDRRGLEDVQGCTFERRSGSDGHVKAVGSLFRVEDAAEWAQVYEGLCVRVFFRDGRSWRQCEADEARMLGYLRWFCARPGFQM